MFKINELKLYSTDGEEYSYFFSEGVNYFKGDNDKGKTEFYNFLDYMLGSSKPLDLSRAWFNKLQKASIKLTVDNSSYIFTRTKNPDINFFKYCETDEDEKISYRIYKERMNSIISSTNNNLINIKEFTGEDFSYRTFTMFNFLGEKGQARTNDFLDKCSDIEYKIKLPSLLDLIFNKNLQEILKLEDELKKLLSEVKNLEKDEFKSDYINEQINENIIKLGLNILYNGTNKDKVLEKLEEAKSLHSIQKRKFGDIVELEYLFNHINEQIKVYETSTVNLKQIEIANENRKKLLENLEQIITNNPEFNYLVTPIKELVLDMKDSISLTNYLITDKTISALSKKRTAIKKEIEQYHHFTKLYNLDEKEKACALLENYLNENTINISAEQLKEKRRRITEIKRQIKELKKSQDIKKIKTLSENITKIYKSAVSSELVKADIAFEGFKITYIKNGNILQTQIQEEIKDSQTQKEKIVDVNFSQGSMARHTLIQIAGYFAFLHMLITDNAYPLIPVLIIDHLSKPFDVKNRKGLGEVINYAVSLIGRENIQIILFDDKEFKDISLIPDHFENLSTSQKTGFIPFYTPPRKDKLNQKE